jgi:hypothetical protein
MAGNSIRRKRGARRAYSDELKGEAVQMLLDVKLLQPVEAGSAQGEV